MTDAVTIPCEDPLRLLRFVPASAKRVLDFGSGAGERLRALSERDVHVIGVDTGDALHQEDRHNVVCDSLDSIELPEGDTNFDCILAEGALARLRDPARILARFRTWLAPGGLLVSSAPNMQHHQMFKMLVEGKWGYAPEGPIPFGQIRYYTGYELHKLLTARGFISVKLMGLAVDEKTAFPLGDDGYVREGRLCVGPLSEGEHTAFLVREYLVIAQAPQ